MVDFMMLYQNNGGCVVFFYDGMVVDLEFVSPERAGQILSSHHDRGAACRQLHDEDQRLRAFFPATAEQTTFWPGHA